MGTYCVKLDDNGERRELFLSFDEMDALRDADGIFTLEGGRTAHRDYEAELAPTEQIKGAWPIHSMALAMHPNKVAEAKEFARERGVNVDFDKKGRPILETPAHRRKYMKVRSVCDLDSWL